MIQRRAPQRDRHPSSVLGAALAEITAVHGSNGHLDATMRQPGILGPQIPVGDDSDGQTRFLAFLGRRA